jgi:small subunit ribosomal protein S20
MPNSPSAKKRQRTNELSRIRNRATKSVIKTQLKRVTASVAAGKVPDAETEFRQATKKLDQAAAKGVIHRNAAARTKSRMSARLKAAKATSSK